MDPWANCRLQSVNAKEVTTDSFPTGDYLAFEDNFKPLVCDSLPDSAEYLAILENRLKKLKSDSDVLGQLTARREACLQQLLNGDINLEENLTLEAPLSNSALLRTILPQKQALTQGEIVQFAKYDQLVDSYVDKEIETERKEDL